jgi:phosphatidate phosphatase APP1
MLSVNDAVIVGGGNLRLSARADREAILGLRNGIKGVAVRFLVDGGEVGHDSTDERGDASVSCKRPETPVTEFEAVAAEGRRELRTRGRIFAWTPDRPIIAVDVDKTISDTDYDDLVLRRRDEESRPLAGSREALSALAADFHIAYVTGRPRFLLEKTRQWLEDNQLPPGPVVTAPRLRDLVRPGKIKRRVLAGLRQDWPNLLIGIGNNQHDAYACGANHMLTLILKRSPERDYGEHAIVLPDWEAIGRFFAANREVLSDPAKLRSAIDGETMLLRPVLPWRESR